MSALDRALPQVPGRVAGVMVQDADDARYHQIDKSGKLARTSHLNRATHLQGERPSRLTSRIPGPIQQADGSH